MKYYVNFYLNIRERSLMVNNHIFVTTLWWLVKAIREFTGVQIHLTSLLSFDPLEPTHVNQVLNSYQFDPSDL